MCVCVCVCVFACLYTAAAAQQTSPSTVDALDLSSPQVLGVANVLLMFYLTQVFLLCC